MPPKIRLLAFIEELKIIDSLDLPLPVKPHYKELVKGSIVELENAIKVSTTSFVIFKQNRLDRQSVFTKIQEIHKRRTFHI